MFWPYPIDWAATGAWMQAWAGFAGAGVVAWAALRGGDSFDRWLRQNQTERKIVAGERILRAVYKAKEAFPQMRSPMQLGEEISAAEAKLKAGYDRYEEQVEGRKQRLQTAQVVLDRIAAHTEIWTEIYECLSIARAYFGADLEDALREVFKQRRILEVSARMYVDADPSRDESFYNKVEADIWEGMALARDEEDRINVAIGEVVSTAERLILPVISTTAAIPQSKELQR